MILSCDPPRHALLLHFGSRRQTGRIVIEYHAYHGAQLETALDRAAATPLLVAVHFVRHGFRLPFVGAQGGDETGPLQIHARREAARHVWHFAPVPPAHQRWQPLAGLNVLVSGPPRGDSRGPRPVEDRTVLFGLEVEPAALGVAVDTSELVVTFRADNLKDAPATLYVRGEPAP